MMKLLLTLFSALLLSVTSAHANDDELYDPAPPADSAFVRVVNAATSIVKAPSMVGSYNYGDIEYPKISDYNIVKQGEYVVTIGDISQKITIEAGAYYTLALTNDLKLVQIKDELLENPAKARVYFYNFSDSPNGALVAVDHNKAIFENIASGAGESREINALKLNVQTKAGDTLIGDYKDVQLKRRVGTSFLISGKAGDYKSIMLENEVKR